MCKRTIAARGCLREIHYCSSIRACNPSRSIFLDPPHALPPTPAVPRSPSFLSPGTQERPGNPERASRSYIHRYIPLVNHPIFPTPTNPSSTVTVHQFLCCLLPAPLEHMRVAHCPYSHDTFQRIAFLAPPRIDDPSPKPSGSCCDQYRLIYELAIHSTSSAKTQRRPWRLPRVNTAGPATAYLIELEETSISTFLYQRCISPSGFTQYIPVHTTLSKSTAYKPELTGRLLVHKLSRHPDWSLWSHTHSLPCC